MELARLFGEDAECSGREARAPQVATQQKKAEVAFRFLSFEICEGAYFNEARVSLILPTFGSSFGVGVCSL